MDQITTLEELTSRYSATIEGAIRKELTELSAEYQALIEASPYCTLATVGPDGLDCTPRGESPGFVRIVDANTLELPDRKGNNRLDSLRNIIADPRLALLFIIPNRNETLRVNGTGSILVDEDVLAAHAIDGKSPATVLRIHVDRVYFHCGKSAIRSRIWDPESWTSAEGLPTTGQIVRSFVPDVDVDAYDAELDQRLRDNLV